MNWDYAELSKCAKAAGGPDCFVQSAMSLGKRKMVPVVIATGIIGLGVGFLLGYGVAYLVQMKDEEIQRDLKDRLDESEEQWRKQE